MVTYSSTRVIMVLLTIMSIAYALTGCGDKQVQNTVTVSYTLPIIPVTFSLDTNGHLSVSVSESIVTELGELKVSAGAAATPFKVPDNSLLITIRHLQDGQLVDTSFQIDTSKIGNADVKGNNISEVKVGWTGKSNSIFIDASNGDITSIVIQGSASKTTSDVGTMVLPTPTPIPTPTQVPPISTPQQSYPHLAFTYQGMADNTTANITTTLTLTSIVQNGEEISGNVIIGPSLQGSGPFTGIIRSDGSVSFTDIPSAGTPTIIFSGSLNADGSLSGTYTAPSVNQAGTWQTTPSSN